MVEHPPARSDSVYVPGPVVEKKPAQQILDAEDWQLREFVVACLRALVADPAGFLASLGDYRPDRRDPGRPSKVQR